MGARRQEAHYIHGSAARRLWPQEERRERQKRKANHAVRKNRDRAKHMNAGYVLFLSAALVAIGLILVYYIGLQSDISGSVKRIASLERRLNEITVENDETYNRILGSVDLEKIRRTAIQELGMQYAKEGQIISFASETNDYVKQMAKIPGKE